MSKITIITYGALWDAAPAATLTVDLRGQLFNPFKDPAHRSKTALDSDVFNRVMNTPGARTLASGLGMAVLALANSGKDITLAVGCAGGRHRSVAIARAVFASLKSTHGDKFEIELVHRDVRKPVWSEELHGPAAS